MKTREHPCVYCGNPGVTGDHVPPKSYFDKPRPTKPAIPIVPACQACQRRFKPAEDYIRTIVILGGAEQSQVGRRIEPTIQRMFSGRKDPGLIRKLSAASKHQPFITAEGLFAGHCIVVDIDWGHVTLFTEKLIKGLYWLEQNMTLPPDVSIEPVHYFQRNGQYLAEHLAICKLGRVGWPGTFQYRWNVASENPNVSLWWFVLYDTFVWHSMSYDIDAKERWIKKQNKGVLANL